MRDKSNSCRTFMGEAEGKRRLEIPRNRWEVKLFLCLTDAMKARDGVEV
jgi:hypothetical protein